MKIVARKKHFGQWVTLTVDSGSTEISEDIFPGTEATSLAYELIAAAAELLDDQDETWSSDLLKMADEVEQV